MNTVIIAKEINIFTEGLKALIEKVTGSTVTIKGLQELFHEHDAEVLIVDLENLSDHQRTILLNKQQTTNLVCWSEKPSLACIKKQLKQSIPYFCSQNSNKTEITQLYRAIENEEPYFGKATLSSSILQVITTNLESGINQEITERDKAVIREYRLVQNLKTIGQRCGLSYGTTRNRFCALRKQFQVQTNDELVSRVNALGLI